MLTFIFNSIQLTFQGASWGKREKLEKKVKAVVGVHKDFGIAVCVLGTPHWEQEFAWGGGVHELPFPCRLSPRFVPSQPQSEILIENFRRNQ